MRTTTDALRSLSRYVAECYGEDWSVSTWSEQGTFARPTIAVRLTGPTLIGGARHTADLIQPVALYVYPAEGESVEGSVVNVLAAEEVLFNAFRVGVGAGRPMRVPLYDYDGVSMDEPSDLRRDPDYLRVLDLSIDRAQSPEDERKWTVIAELRVGWRRAGELPGADATRLAEGLRLDLSGA